MGNLKTMWKKSSRVERVARVINLLLACCVIILSLMGLARIIAIDITNSIIIPMLGFISLFNGLETYKKDKLTGIIILLCSGFILISCIYCIFTEFLI